MKTFSPEEFERYSRHFILKGWSMEVQQRIASLRCLISSRAEASVRYLAGAGIRSVQLFEREANPWLVESLKDFNPHVEYPQNLEAVDFVICFADEVAKIPNEHQAATRFVISSEKNAFPSLRVQAEIAAEVLRRFGLGLPA